MKKFKGKGKTVIAIIVMMFITMGAVGIAPAMAKIAMAFPDKSTEEIQLLMSLPSLATLVSALCASFVSDRFGKKNTVIAGIVIFLITGLVPVFVSNWTLVVLSRIGIGIGTGLVNCLDTVLIFDHFEDKDQQNTMLGWQQVGNDIGYIVMALAAGYLTLISWQAAFIVHALGILSLVIVIFFLPNDVIKTTSDAKEDAKPAGRKYLTIGCIFWLLMVLIFEGTLHTFSMNISFLVVDVGVGDSVLAGYASTMMTVGGFIVAAFYGKLFSVMKRWTFSFGCLIDVVAMICLYAMGPNDPALAWLGGALIGAGMVIVFSTATAYVMRSINAASRALASALFLVCINGGQFVNPYWGSFLTNTFAGGTVRGKFICAAVVLAIVMVIGIFTAEKVGTKAVEK